MLLLSLWPEVPEPLLSPLHFLFIREINTESLGFSLAWSGGSLGIVANRGCEKVCRGYLPSCHLGSVSELGKQNNLISFRSEEGCSFVMASILYPFRSRDHEQVGWRV